MYFENYPDVVGIDDLMKMLSICRNKAYELVNCGLIKSIKIGRVHKIPKNCIISYINNQID
jgi:hypothetical protein